MQKIREIVKSINLLGFFACFTYIRNTAHTTKRTGWACRDTPPSRAGLTAAAHWQLHEFVQILWPRAEGVAVQEAAPEEATLRRGSNGLGLPSQ